MTIKDGLLAPYEIHTNKGGGFSVEKVTTVQDKESKNFGEERLVNHGYFPRIEGCVSKIIRLKTYNSFDGKVTTLEEYLKELKSYCKLLKDFTKDEK